MERYCCSAFSTRISQRAGRAPCWSCLPWKAFMPKLSCLLPVWSHSTKYPSGFWLLAPSLLSVTLLLSLDVRLLSGLPGFDSWLSLKDWSAFGQEALQSTLNTTIPSESISLALMSWTATGWLDWPEDSANAKGYWEVGVFIKTVWEALNTCRIIT